MNRRTLSKLYELRGMLKASRDIAKAEIKAIIERPREELQRWTKGYLDGQFDAYQREIKHCERAIQQLTQTIEEAENARE